MPIYLFSACEVRHQNFQGTRDAKAELRRKVMRFDAEVTLSQMPRGCREKEEVATREEVARRHIELEILVGESSATVECISTVQFSVALRHKPSVRFGGTRATSDAD